MPYDALVERMVAVPRAFVYETLFDFGAVDQLLPGSLSGCECIGVDVGAQRTLTLSGGGQVVERLDIAHDGAVIGYSMLENNALPLSHYVAVVSLFEVSETTTTISYGSNWLPLEVEDDEVRVQLEGLYNDIIDGIVASYATQAGDQA